MRASSESHAAAVLSAAEHRLEQRRTAFSEDEPTSIIELLVPNSEFKCLVDECLVDFLVGRGPSTTAFATLWQSAHPKIVVACSGAY
jgi:hypothetical protein